MNPEFARQLAERPNSFVFGPLTIFPEAVAIIALVSWIVMGEIGALEGLIGIAVVILVGFFAINPPMDWLSLVAFTLMWLLVIGYPIAQVAMNRRNLREIDVNAVHNACVDLAARPADYLKMLYIARLLHYLGHDGNAIGIARRALSMAPDDMPLNERNEIKSWMVYATPDNLRLLTCAECGSVPAEDAFQCPTCGELFLAAGSSPGMMRTNYARKAATVAVIGIGILILIPALSAAGPLFAIIGIPLLLLASGALILKTLVKKKAVAH